MKRMWVSSDDPIRYDVLSHKFLQGVPKAGKNIGMLPSRLHIHVGISACLFLVALAGWGAFAHAMLSRNATQVELRRELRHLTVERDQGLDRQRVLDSELKASKVELAIVQKGVQGLIKALEASRAELVSAQYQLEVARPQAHSKP